VAALTALQGLRDKGKIQSGSSLDQRASGGVGTFAVQSRKSFGAAVTGVCSTRNLDLVRSIGADHVMIHQRGFTKTDQTLRLISTPLESLVLGTPARFESNGICVMAGIGGAGWHDGFAKRWLVSSRHICGHGSSAKNS